MSQPNQNKEPRRVGVVVVTHGRFCASLADAAATILGPLEQCETVSIEVADSIEQSVDSLKKAIDKVNKGGGAVLLTDMFGGTPSNLALSVMGYSHLEVVTGVNLPMLLKVLTVRGLGPKEAAAEAKKAGQQGIVVAGELVRRKQAG